MKVVITGALGHIGSRLIREFPRSFPGVELTLIDNLSTQRYCSLFDLPAGAVYRFHETDILQGDLHLLFQGADVVIHLAAITNAEGSFEIKEQVEMVNFEGTKRVAATCVNLQIPLVFLSTTSVYGTQKEVVDEECSVDDLKPQSPYASAKLAAELHLQNLGKHGMPFVICRFGTIFGPSIGMRFHTAVNKFCWQAVLGLPLTVWKTAYEQYRPYLALEDGINAILFIVKKRLFDCSTYNVLTTNASVKQIVETIKRFIPTVQVQFVESQIMNQLTFQVSDQRFRNVGFQPTGSLESGIGQTIRLLRMIQR
jgi:UDP-glucose 4-epimerase